MGPVWWVRGAGPDARMGRVDSALGTVGKHPKILNMVRLNERRY